MKAIRFVNLAVIGALLACGSAHAMGKPLKPLPAKDKAYDIAAIDKIIVDADAAGKLPNCAVDQAPGHHLIDQQGHYAFYQINSKLVAYKAGNISLSNPTHEFSDSTAADGTRVIRIAEYQEHSLDGILPSYEKRILQLKLKDGALISLKAWDYQDLDAPTANDAEPASYQVPAATPSSAIEYVEIICE